MLRERAFVKYKPTELFSGEAQRKSGFCQTKGQVENCFSKLAKLIQTKIKLLTFDKRYSISNYDLHTFFFLFKKSFFILNKLQSD